VNFLPKNRIDYGVVGAKPSNMDKVKSIFNVSSLYSVALMPMFLINSTFMPYHQLALSEVISGEEAGENSNSRAETIRVVGANIDAYMADRDMPLAGFGEVFAEAALENNIDPYLLAAISVRESTGGKHTCKSESGRFNPLGWGSCKIAFGSYEEAIRRVSAHLGGNVEKTAHYYSDKDVREKLQTYNPPHIVARYADQVIAIMEEMENYNA
jgi:hypothetical protein